jgi:inosine-uridine nucleoside N-ribohydrolase
MTWDAVVPRARVISDNDYGGDPDGLVQLAHLLLSPSIVIPFVIGSHLGAGDPFNPDGRSAARAVAAARRVSQLSGRTDVRIIEGTETALVARDQPIESDAATAIVAEAMRRDDLPLFVTCGGGLTEIASAWLLEPRIAARTTLVWIGGGEYDGVASPPDTSAVEYNAAIDPIAIQVVFNDSSLPVWQVPRDVYRMATASRAELLTRVATCGELGRHLFDCLGRVVDRLSSSGLHLGETFILGDNPLVLLTALQTSFHPDPASSPSTIRSCPRVLDSGAFEATSDGRPIRVFTGLDTRLMLDDLYAKLALHASR